MSERKWLPPLASYMLGFVLMIAMFLILGTLSDEDGVLQRLIWGVFILPSRLLLPEDFGNVHEKSTWLIMFTLSWLFNGTVILAVWQLSKLRKISK